MTISLSLLSRRNLGRSGLVSLWRNRLHARCWSWLDTLGWCNWLAIHRWRSRIANLLCAIGFHIYQALHQGLHEADDLTPLVRGQLLFDELTNDGSDSVDLLLRWCGVHLRYELSQLLVLDRHVCR